jgi:hypothetical protein
MTTERRWRLASWLASAALASSSGARAQVHWDLGAQAGVTDRIALGPALARTPGPGGEIHAHVAVYPMVRVGPYAAFDLSPLSGRPDRRIYVGGVRIKITPPWLAAPWRAWGFLGLGVAYALTPSSPSFRAAWAVMPELPVGVGLSHKLHGPWDLCAELGARWIGALGPAPAYIGNDLLAVSLSVGVSLAP